MKCLYGSQNLGYATAESDKDYMEFVYPSWKDILNNKCISTERVEDDGSHTKIYDIRNIPKLISSGHFTGLQFMFSTETMDFEDLQWFIDNRDKLCRLNMYNSYKANSKNMISNLEKGHSPKDLARCYAFLCMSKRLLEDKPFEMYNPDTLTYRIAMSKLSDVELEIEAKQLIKDYKELEVEYIKYKDSIDHKTWIAMEEEIYRLLKRKLLK